MDPWITSTTQSGQRRGRTQAAWSCRPGQPTAARPGARCVVGVSPAGERDRFRCAPRPLSSSRGIPGRGIMTAHPGPAEHLQPDHPQLPVTQTRKASPPEAGVSVPPHQPAPQGQQAGHGSRQQHVQPVEPGNDPVAGDGAAEDPQHQMVPASGIDSSTPWSTPGCRPTSCRAAGPCRSTPPPCP